LRSLNERQNIFATDLTINNSDCLKAHQEREKRVSSEMGKQARKRNVVQEEALKGEQRPGIL
jgi:hypothetical protein